jgi:pimeloyl-ACP methyl ester carboxylesterase
MYCFLVPCPVPPGSAFRSSRSRTHKLAYTVRATASPVTVTRHGGARPDLPRLLYLGGLDGAALPRAQAETLRNCFDPVSICPSAEDRSGWDALALAVAAVVCEEASDAGKPVVLVGESFGAALALRVAALDRGHGHIKRLVIVNPGTALASETFLRSFTALLPLLRLDGSGTVLYRVAALILYKNFLVDEQRLRPDCIPGDGSWLARSVDIAAVPLEVMLHRVQLLRTFQDSFGDACLARLVTVPTTLVASKHDRLFPSRRESERLAGLLSNVVARVILEHSAHACLLERDVSLIDLIYPDRSVARKVKNGPAFIQYAAFQRKRISKGRVPKQPAPSGESKSSELLSAFHVQHSNEYKEDDMASSKSYDALVVHKIAGADAMLSDGAGLMASQNQTKTVTSSHVRDWNLDKSQKGNVADQNEPDMSFEEAFNLGQRFLTPWRTLIKPVFSGRHFVADAMKDHFESKRPVLFVGNHG